jgi:LacI family transcriptional regulator
VDPEREIEYTKDLISRKVDGIILCWYKDTPEKTEFLKEALKQVPIVLMDQPAKGLSASSVYTDGYRGIKQLTKALVGQGHEHIAMIVEDRQYTAHERRFQGYCDALKECGKDIDQNLIIENEIGFKSGYEGAKKLLSQAKPTAIVTIDDLTAVGILEYLSDNNIRVPEDIWVTGFDNIPLSQYCSPRLTTIAQPVEELAKTAMKLIIKKIQNRRARNQEVVFKPEIIVRKSAPLNHEKEGS